MAFSGSRRALLGGGSYLAQSLALFARFTTPPTTADKRIINNTISALLNTGLWTKCDAIYFPAAATAQAAQRNWVQDLYNLTPTNSPTFTPYRGYAGNGTTSYLDTGFNPSSASSPKLTQNSAHISAWDNTSRAANSTTIIGARQSTANYDDITPFFTGSVSVGRVNSSAAAGISASVGGSRGQFVANRSNISNQQLYYNGASIGTNTSAVSVAPPNVNIMLLARGVNGSSPDAYTTDTVSQASIGSTLSSTDVANLYAISLAYMQAVGAI